MVLTSSTAGLRAYPNTAHYTAAKHGVIGLMKVLAQEVGPHRHSCQRGLPDHRTDPAGHQRRDVRAVRSRRRDAGRGRCPGSVRRTEHPARSRLDRARRRVRRRAVPVLGRRQVHHRRRVADRCRQRRQDLSERSQVVSTVQALTPGAPYTWVKPTRQSFRTCRSPASPRSCSDDLVHLAQPGGADRLAARQAAAVGVDRQTAAELRVAALDQKPPARRARTARSRRGA